jgi:uncharacterized protein with GYD domain
MPRYLGQISYTTTGAKGCWPPWRRRNLSPQRHYCDGESVGGHVEVCYYAFGTTDLYLIGEVPDEVGAASLSLRTADCGRRGRPIPDRGVANSRAARRGNPPRCFLPAARGRLIAVCFGR